MLKKLEEHDPRLVRLGDESAAVLLAPTLQARIFCQLDGQLIHRLDVERLENPSAEEFNNLGGNSLWPAPEGGPFAFNYLPGSDRWVVQPGIGSQPAEILSAGRDWAAIAKTVELVNRKGVEIQVRYTRSVELIDPGAHAVGTGLRRVAYACTDSFEPLGNYSSQEVLIAPWSLEQFPTSAGVEVFCTVQDPKSAINFDFYGTPGRQPEYQDSAFLIPLDGAGKFQIGIRVQNQPGLIGALDPVRSLLIIRETLAQPGLYFNIADNDQPAGPFSAADLYSIFNGGDLGFFELETIAPMQVCDGRLVRSELTSKTTIIKGRPDELERAMKDQCGV